MRRITVRVQFQKNIDARQILKAKRCRSNAIGKFNVPSCYDMVTDVLQYAVTFDDIRVRKYKY